MENTELERDLARQVAALKRELAESTAKRIELREALATALRLIEYLSNHTEDE